MKDVLLTLVHLAVMVAKLCRPGGVRAIMSENLLLEQQLIVVGRARQFRCESIVLKSYWVLVVMDQFTRRLIGFGVHRGAVMDPVYAGCSTPRFTDRACRAI